MPGTHIARQDLVQYSKWNNIFTRQQAQENYPQTQCKLPESQTTRFPKRQSNIAKHKLHLLHGAIQLLRS